jgi:hypothetical protein
MSQIEPTLTDVVTAGLHRVQVATRTLIPALVTKYKRRPREVSVQIAVNARLYNGDVVSIPEIEHVPVITPAMGGWSMDADLLVGEEVMLLICDRDISGWIDEGSVGDPMTGRLHSVSDAVALVGLRSNPHEGMGAAPGYMQIGRENGASPQLVMHHQSADIMLQASTIHMGSEAATLGVARLTDTTTASAQMSTFMTLLTTALTAITAIPANAAAAPAAANALAALSPAVTSLGIINSASTVSKTL